MVCVSYLRASCRSEMSCCPRRSRWKTAKVARSRWPDDSFRTLSRFGEAGFLAEPQRRVDRTCEVISERCERELASVVFRRRNQGEPPHDKTESINGWLVDRWHRFERWHHPAIDVLAIGYRPLASCSRESGLERSDFVLWPEAACFGPRPPPLAVASRIGRVWAPPALMPPSSGSQPLTQLGRLPHSNSMHAKGSSAGRLDCAASVRDSGIE